MPTQTQTQADSRSEEPVSHREVVEQLFREARDDVYYYIQSFGLAAHEAQEIAQDVFLRLYASLKRGDQIESPRGWVFRVAHNLALNAINKAESRRVSTLDPLEEKADKQASPEAALIRQETAAKIRRALASLSPQQRLVIQLRAEGLRYAEIARIMQVGTSTVGEFLSRAIKKLRKAVDE